MRAYELILIGKGSLSDALRKKLITSVKSLLKPASLASLRSGPQGGDLKIVKENEVGLKSLAYKIKREASGFYWNFGLEGETVPADFERKLLENENILRHLVLRKK